MSANAHRRCPLSTNGVSASDLERCPGFARIEVTFGRGQPGDRLAAAWTCGHLGPERIGRGFAAICHHPDAERVTELAGLIPAAG